MRIKLGAPWLFASSLVLLIPQVANAESAFEQLVAASEAELAGTDGKLVMALDWPDRDALPVLDAFKEDFPYIKEINYTRETGIGPFGRYLLSIQQGEFPPYDIMHVASEFEGEYWSAGAFMEPPFSYQELSDSLPADWPELHPGAMDPDGNFISTTGNVRGNAWNPNLVPDGEEPTTWAACLDPKWKGKIIHDARNKLQAFQYDEQERARHIEWLKQLKENEVVLVRGQSSVLKKVAAGEFPIACGINYHTAYRMIERDGVDTLKFTLAETIPLELGTRLYVGKWSRTPATAQLFALWAATEGQSALGEFAYRGFPWNPLAHKFEASQGKYVALCGAECALQWEDFNREHQDLLGIPVAKTD